MTSFDVTGFGTYQKDVSCMCKGEQERDRVRERCDEGQVTRHHNDVAKWKWSKTNKMFKEYKKNAFYIFRFHSAYRHSIISIISLRYSHCWYTRLHIKLCKTRIRWPLIVRERHTKRGQVILALHSLMYSHLYLSSKIDHGPCELLNTAFIQIFDSKAWLPTLFRELWWTEGKHTK